MSIKDTFLVLRTSHYRDSDLVVSLLGKESGKIQTLARGARNSKKRFPGGIEVFDLAQITLESGARNREHLSIKEFKRLKDWNKIRKSISSFSHACLCTEVVDSVTQVNDPDSKMLFRLLANSFTALENAKDKKTKIAISSYLLASTLEISGFFSLAELSTSNEEVKSWFAAMLKQKAPITPFNEEIGPKGLELVAELLMKTTEKKLNSWDFLSTDL